jgi:hypothetical protein
MGGFLKQFVLFTSFLALQIFLTPFGNEQPLLNPPAERDLDRSEDWKRSNLSQSAKRDSCHFFKLPCERRF